MKFLTNARCVIGLFSILVSACTQYPPLTDRDTASADYTYQIGPGDELNVFVWGNPDISTAVPVRPDGKITVPLVEDVVASGKTSNELARELEKKYKEFVKDPQVVVMVTSFQGMDQQQIRVVGQINGGSGVRSGGTATALSTSSQGNSRYSGMTIPYEKGMTLLDLMIKIGAIGQYADGNRASVIRNVNGKPRQFGVKLDTLVEDGDLSANVKMAPGDILIIPEAFF
ncbi:MAG: polysaccharide export protein [Methylococcales bacterium]|nr:polysaccharide export protein [Methylococcales bacterium]